ncbi:hypothetical protein BJ741DRAFT_625936 [Chytriomyces cf. hyalinus JEL632]|nr:hypothetical protein BJ741DRAFT_625936 [Chytriomyces cf. hyalinus JEL632]
MSSSSSGGSSSRNSENVSIESASPNTGGRAARASASTSSWFKLFSSFPRRSHRHTNIVPLIPDNAISEPRNLSNERNVVTASDEQRSGGLAEAVDPTPAVETASQRENPDTNGTAALQNTQIESESEECVDPDVSNPVSTSSNVPLIEVANAAEPDSVTPRSIPSAPSAVSRTPQPTSNPTEHTIDQSSMRSLPNPAVFPPIHHISRLQQRRNAIDYTAHLIDAAQSDTQTPSLPEIAFFLRNGIIPAQTPLQPPIRATSEDPLITPAPQPRNPPLEYQASRPRGIYINHMPSPNPEEPDQPIYLRHLRGSEKVCKLPRPLPGLCKMIQKTKKHKWHKKQT